jgi:hypothetical protein
MNPDIGLTVIIAVIVVAFVVVLVVASKIRWESDETPSDHPDPDADGTSDDQYGNHHDDQDDEELVTGSKHVLSTRMGLNCTFVVDRIDEEEDVVIGHCLVDIPPSAENSALTYDSNGDIINLTYTTANGIPVAISFETDNLPEALEYLDIDIEYVTGSPVRFN